MRYLIFLLLFISCKNDSEKSKSHAVDSLVIQNKKLKEEINNLRTEGSKKEENSVPIVSTKYAYVLITYMKKHFGRPSEPYISWSSITRLEHFDEDVKYRLMDEFESKFLSSGEGIMFVENIIKRECFAFDSYVEASKHQEARKI